MPTDPLNLSAFIASHGGHQQVTPLHWNLLFLCISVNCLVIALTPPSPRGKLLRAGVAPLSLAYYAYFILFLRHPDWDQQFGCAAGITLHVMHTLQFMVFYSAEEHNYRMKPKAGAVVAANGEVPEGRLNEGVKGDQRDGMRSAGDIKPSNVSTEKHRPAKTTGAEVLLYRETAPQHGTLAKFYWAHGMYWSYRGIGWNYQCPLPPDSRRHPYLRTSTRAAFLKRQIWCLVRGALLNDLCRAWMNCGPGAPFFSGRPRVAPAYSSLTHLERALYSLPIAERVTWSIVMWYYLTSIGCVVIGGITGWEGEWWEPWGWPPAFGTLGDVWRNPGLGFMWAKTWHQYERRWLYLFGWLGLGEKVLGLRHSGLSSRPIPPATAPAHLPAAPSGVSSSNASFLANGLGENDKASSEQEADEPSGRASPAHPLPTSPLSIRPTRRFTPGMMLSNLIKSLLVFMLTGLFHDIPLYMVYLHTTPAGKPLTWGDMHFTMPFFLLQPCAIAVEALVIRLWRTWKVRTYGPSQRARKSSNGHANGQANGHVHAERDALEMRGEPAWLVTFERVVGFISTWVWLGVTARFFVLAFTKAGLYWRGEDQRLAPSLFGGLIWGRWKH